MRTAHVSISQHWPFGYDREWQPWLTLQWDGRPWWRTLITLDLWRDIDLRLLPWPVTVVDFQAWDLCYVLVRRDGLLIFSALAWWLWYHVVQPSYWRVEHQCFRMARRFGYGCILEGVMPRWRDLFVRQQSGRRP